MSDPLHDFARRLSRFMDPGAPGLPFESLALELFQLQFERNTAYRRYCGAAGLPSDPVTRLEQIPAAPTLAFKELEMSALPPSERVRVFHSSGTTGQQPSRHFHGTESLALYEASLEAGFRRAFLGGVANGGTVQNGVAGLSDGQFVPISLTPSPEAAPHSSLVHMLDRVGFRFGARPTVYGGRIGDGGVWEVDVEGVMQALGRCAESGESVFLAGTAFNYVHWIEGLERRGVWLKLPPGSRLMETGGYKGRSREWTKEELRSALARIMGMPLSAIVGEYGMSELSSQAYEQPVVESCEAGPRAPSADRGFVFPPWARALVISPETGRVAGDGETGLLRILDLANVWSVMAVQTEDRAVIRGGLIELLGRASASEPRGCSLMAA